MLYLELDTIRGAYMFYKHLLLIYREKEREYQEEKEKLRTQLTTEHNNYKTSSEAQISK